MYQALYRKWRPLRFADVVGQNHITDTLRAQLESGRLSHAYLFTGTRGTGKTTCAKILARAVNCQHPNNGDPCNECPACRGILDGSILDVVEIDAASNNGVDNIRDIRDETRYTPTAVKKRVYIIDEVHMLSQGAFNALLKTLEEPPEHVLFILATTEIHKVPATILSRCQRFDFRRIAPSDIAHRIREVAESEHIALTDGGADMIARLADGALRDALSILDRTAAGADGPIDEDTVARNVGILAGDSAVDLMRSISAGDLADAVGQLASFYAAGRDLAAVLDQLLSLIRDMLLVQTSRSDVSALISPAYPVQTVQRLCENMPASRLIAYSGILQETIARMSRAGNKRIEAELCVVRLCRLTAEDHDTLSGRLDALEEKLSSGAFTAAAPQKAARPKKQAAAEAEDDTPPWEEPSKPKAESKPFEAKSAPEWEKIYMAVHKRVPLSVFSHLMTSTGMFHDNNLIVLCKSPVARDTLSKDSVKQVLAAAAQQITGQEYRIKVVEEEQVSKLSTKANPLDEIVKRTTSLNIPTQVID